MDSPHTFSDDEGRVVVLIKDLIEAPFVVARNLVISFKLLVFLVQHNGCAVAVLLTEDTLNNTSANAFQRLL